jgi:hypothetical protein
VDALLSVQQTVDGGYILAGESSSGISGDKTQNTWGASDYWIVKTDSLGNMQWDKDFGGTDYEEHSFMQQTADGGYLLSGDSYSPISGDKTEANLGQEQTWILKTDSLGNKQWDKTIFTTGHDERGLAIQTKDGCYAVANITSAGIGGYKTQPTWGLSDYWFVKFCDTTSTTSISPVKNFPISFSIYPNPFSDKLTVTSKTNQPFEITLFDITSRKLLQQQFTNSTSINTSHLSKGIYIYELRTKNGVIKKGKVVKE